MKMPDHPIFAGIAQEEYEEMARRGCIRLADYPKEEVLLRTGDKTEEFGILLSGKIHIENIDLWGSRMILHSILPGGAFGETYAFCQAPMMVDVLAVEQSQVLWVRLTALLSPQNEREGWYHKLLRNVLILSTQKNLAWSSRVFCISAKTIRGRVMTYLSSEALRTGKRQFTIPFDRQQMADYLNVERSALSKELGKMQREGILTFRKNTFCLLKTAGDC